MKRIPLVAMMLFTTGAAWAFEKIALVDDMDFSWYFDIERPEGIRGVFDFVHETGATYQFWRAQAGGMLRYPSHAEYDGNPTTEAPVDKRKIAANFGDVGWLKVDEMKFDAMRAAVECCRERQVGFGIHWSTEESHGATWCLGPWNLSHPEYWCRTVDGAPWHGRASLAFPEVIEHKVAIAKELNGYAPKKLYLDFYRAYGAETRWEYVKPVIDAWRERYHCEPPKDSADSRWRELVMEFNHRFIRALHRAMPNTELILAVDRFSLEDDWLLDNRAIDWRALVREGSVDAIGIMCLKPDWNDPWNYTEKAYRYVIDQCRGKAKVYFPVNAYSGAIRAGLYEYAKRTGITPEAATQKLLELSAAVGAEGVTLECVDYGNYTPGVTKVIREFKPPAKP